MSESVRVTGKQLAEFFRVYYGSEDPNMIKQRLGQAFCNYFEINDEILFYEESDRTAANLIGEYVK